MHFLKKLTIPSSVTQIEWQVFENPDALTIYGCAGSYAETYANDEGLRFVDITNHAAGITAVEDTLCLPVGMTIRPELQLVPADTTDAVVLESSDPSVAMVKNGIRLQGLKPGTVTVTARTENGLSCRFTVVVKKLTGLELTSLPKRLSYETGEPLDAEGLEVQACFADGTSEPVTDYLLLDYRENKPGYQRVAVRYGEAETTFDVTVQEPRTGQITNNLQWVLRYGNQISIEGDLPWNGQVFAASMDGCGKILSVGILDDENRSVFAHKEAVAIRLILADISLRPLENKTEITLVQ